MTEPAAPAPKKSGKPPKIISAETREAIKALVSLDWGVERIAAFLKIAPVTLRKHCRAELGPIKSGPKLSKFTDAQRGEVRGLAMANLPKDQIAKFIGIDEKTLNKHFAEELTKGRLTLIAGAATNMARMALGSKAELDEKGNIIRAEVRPEFVACCYVLKTQGKEFGWAERFEHSGKDGGAIPIRLSSLNDSQLAQLLERLEKG